MNYWIHWKYCENKGARYIDFLETIDDIGNMKLTKIKI